MLNLNITLNQFKRYENCRKANACNMNCIGSIQVVTGLSREEVIYIMENHYELSKNLGVQK